MGKEPLRFGKTKPVKRGDVISNGKNDYKVKRIKKHDCPTCQGSGVEWQITLLSQYGATFEQSLSKLITCGYEKT